MVPSTPPIRPDPFHVQPCAGDLSATIPHMPAPCTLPDHGALRAVGRAFTALCYLDTSSMGVVAEGTAQAADQTHTPPMIRSMAFLVGLLLCVTTPVKAQSSIGKAVVTERDGLRVVVGKDSAFSSDVENAEMLEIELITLDELTQGVMVELQKLQPTDSARATMEKEQRYWSEARTKQCHAEGRMVGRKQRKQQELGCRRWAALARLEELLIRYDELAVPNLPEPQQMEGPGQ